MNDTVNQNDIFETAKEFPDPDAQVRLSRLVGLDEQIARIAKIIGLLINEQGISDWQAKYHSDALQIKELILRRPPLIIFEGDVGSGKSELAETIGDSVARNENIEITLYPLSLSSRGEGRVGEMTKLVSAAFELTIEAASKLKREYAKAQGGVILLVDEADALTQSRESSQMHHEDRAGVNAFIRGIDRIANAQLPAAIIMCTNRVNALDPAIKRRAADILSFARPNSDQREAVLANFLLPLGLSKKDISLLAKQTGETDKRQYGLTYSDITQRLLPAIILDAYPDAPVTAKQALNVAEGILPTPPFQENKYE